MKKSTIKRIGVLALALCLITSCFLSGAMAKYVKTLKGGDTATVAKFVFSVKDENAKAYTTAGETVDLFDTIVPLGAGTVADDLIAPGCKGDFQVVISAEGSQVDLDITSLVTVTNENSIPVKFAVSDSATAPANDAAYTLAYGGLKAALEAAINDEFQQGGTQAKTVYVYWNWVDAQGDPADTTIGEYGENAAPTFKIDIAVTATQALDARIVP